MNREEILERSQKENKNRLDERLWQVRLRGKALSRSVGLILCLVLCTLGSELSGIELLHTCGMALYCGMCAVEEVYCAIKEKTRGQWILAAIFTVGTIAFLTMYVLQLLKVI